MTTFRTTLKIPTRQEMDYEQRYLLIGSCFAQNMGHYFTNLGFSALINPFGILYNPESIALVLERIVQGDPFTENELFYSNELWNSWMHHGSFSTADKEQTLNGINQALVEAHVHLEQTNRLIITFGSSWIYSYHGQVVANCHKVALKEFEQRRLSVNEICTHYRQLLNRLFSINKDLKVTLTVSPVRYLGQGYLASHTNKATLLLACETLCEEFEAVHYFPAYELLLDDLRDYRFYAEDMIHPSAQAIGYIWEQFAACHFTKESLKMMTQVEKLQRALHHRPLHPDTEAYRDFVKKTQQQIAELKERHPLLHLE